MLEYALPVLFALLVWWFSTGAILYLVRLPRRTYRWTMLAASLVLVAAFHELVRYRSDVSVWGAYASFMCGLLIWAWLEVSFLTGMITGSRKVACPAQCRGWRHFIHAVQTILYHELAILVAAIAMAAATWGEPNQVGTWTFLLLWVMRLSAKINVFLGVPNLPEDFLEPHLGYLNAYFRRRRMNPLLPVSVVLAILMAVLLAERAFAPGAAPFDVAAFTLLFTFVALAILEHLFLVLPVPVAAFWSGWGQPRKPAGGVPVPVADFHLNWGRMRPETPGHPIPAKNKGDQGNPARGEME